MTFTPSLLDPRFVAIVAVVAATRVVVPRRHHALFGAAAGALLVGVAAPQTLLAIAAISLGWLYPLHRLSCAARERSWPAAVRRAIVPVGVIVLVLLLLLSKALRFFTLPWFDGTGVTAQLTAIVGLSYFLFRAIDFLWMQSVLRLDERQPWCLLFYTLFPTTLTSGPIQKYGDFRTQVADPVPLDRAVLADATYRVTRGFFRKLVVAFALNAAVTRLLAPPVLTAPQSALLVIVLYLYFYFDFAGYSDIAIGLGLLLGIRVPENFRQPFTATTVAEFWRHWHISLVDWFREHVFIPLGGMTSTRARAAALALLVMLLCGLWHGLTLAFIVWGLWHGLALWIEAMSGARPVPRERRHGPGYWSRVGWTNLKVALPSLLFLPHPADALRVCQGFAHWAIR